MLPMTPPDGTIALLLLVALGSWFQTLTGFGLGLIVVGAASGLGLPLAGVATFVNLVSLPQNALALRGWRAHIDWRLAAAAVAGLLPAVTLGVLLLQRLDVTATLALQALLGALVLHAALGLLRQPRPLMRRSPTHSFVLSGLAGGLMGGLFGMAGPPLILHFYRQPLELPRIRSVLLVVFTAMSLWRTLASAAHGGIDTAMLLQALAALPVAALATHAARRFPPRLSQAALRRVAYAVLLALGSWLLLDALLRLASVA
jgi:uncharacterized membrane protein YfcA